MSNSSTSPIQARTADNQRTAQTIIFGFECPPFEKRWPRGAGGPFFLEGIRHLLNRTYTLGS